MLSYSLSIKTKQKCPHIEFKHRNVVIDNQNKGLPENVAYYNKAKYGVDVLYQMARKYA